MCFAINIIGEKRLKRLIQKEVADLVFVACVCVCVCLVIKYLLVLNNK